MYAKSIAAAALVALLPSALAGCATVQNNCEVDIFVWSIANSADVTMETLSAGNSSYSENYRINPDGGGISIKVAKQASQSEITQFEYTLSGDTIFYDMSNINGYPFKSEGLSLVPSMGKCPTVTCDAGQDCTEAYNLPDDVDTKGCSSETDLVLIICPASAPAPATDAPPAPSASTAAPATSTTAEAAPTTTAPVASAAAGEFVEEAVSTADATTIAPVTWHSVNKRRGHSHGHRFARRQHS